MKTFNVLPTNPDFRKLSDMQLELMLYSLEEDHREMELARKGLAVESEHYDSSFEEEVWSRDVGDWEVLKEGHDPDEIARQIEEITKEEDKINLMSKFDSLEEYNDYLEAGGQTPREAEVSEYIDNQIRAAQERAKALEAGKRSKDGKVFMDDRDLPEVSEQSEGMDRLDREAIERSIELFNGEDEDDDEYTVL